jgi:hypothetical protein
MLIEDPKPIVSHLLVVVLLSYLANGTVTKGVWPVFSPVERRV